MSDIRMLPPQSAVEILGGFIGHALFWSFIAIFIFGYSPW
jgi:hypothetical protein